MARKLYISNNGEQITMVIHFENRTDTDTVTAGAQRSFSHSLRNDDVIEYITLGNAENSGAEPSDPREVEGWTIIKVFEFIYSSQDQPLVSIQGEQDLSKIVLINIVAKEMREN